MNKLKTFYVSEKGHRIRIKRFLLLMKPTMPSVYKIQSNQFCTSFFNEPMEFLEKANLQFFLFTIEQFSKYFSIFLRSLSEEQKLENISMKQK